MPMEPRESTVKRVNLFELSPEACADGAFKGYERLHRINSASITNRDERFNNLMHHFSIGNLREAFRQIHGNAAVGIDHVTKEMYAQDLEANLLELRDSIFRGGWRPQPSREKLIPKPQGGFRPLAIGCVEDKIVQLLMAKILEAIYEPIFHRHSYGFRPRRNAHHAIARMYDIISERPDKCVVVEMDIEKFFNSINHDRLMELIEQKIADPSCLRLIRRMLRNSILHENGEISPSSEGTPQGSPVSPILANIYLHYILDLWFDENYAGKGNIIRYADDAVFVFTSEQTAQEFKLALQERLEGFGKIKLNLDKSGLLRFHSKTQEGGLTFLGFTLYWGKNKSGKTLLKIKTAKKTIAASMSAFNEWIKRARHKYKLDKIWELAAAKLRGHYGYFGITFNNQKLNHYYFHAIGVLFKWLNRRSQKRSFTWERFSKRLLFNPLPKPPKGGEVWDIFAGLGSELKHKPRSRMRKLRTSGSNRSAGWQHPAFT
jgi:RNA-directed DNA polymerase